MIEEKKFRSKFMLTFQFIVLVISINIFQNILIYINATIEINLDEPVKNLLSKGVKYIEFYTNEPRFNSQEQVPIIYTGVLQVNNKNINVYVCVIPKVYKKPNIRIKTRSWNIEIILKKISIKYKDTLFFNLNPINHKNIKPILQTYESDNFYYCVQEMPNDEENVMIPVDLEELSLWQAKKLILCYCYGLKVLNENNIVFGCYCITEMAIDKYFNARFNQYLNISSYFKSLGGLYKWMSYQENICLDLYDFSESPEGSFEKLKKSFVYNDILHFRTFCSKVLLKTVSIFENEKQEQEFLRNFFFYKHLLSIEEQDALNCINFIINDEEFKFNIITLPDFRKFTDDSGETPNYTFTKEDNKLKVSVRKNQCLKIEYEFRFAENVHSIQLNNGNIHYRDLEVRKNGYLIDLDDLNQEGFSGYKKEMEHLVLEVEMYNCKNSKYKLFNEIVDIFLFADPKLRYSFIFKINFVECNNFLFIKILDDGIKYEGLEESLTEAKYNEYSEELNEFIENIKFLFNEEDYNKHIGLHIDSKEDLKGYIFQLPFFFVPGLGSRREIREDEIYHVESNIMQLLDGDVIYKLNRCNVNVLFRDDAFFEIKVSDEGFLSLIRLNKEEVRRDEFMKDIEYLLSGSFIRIN